MKIAINILPPSYRRQGLVRRRTMQWSAVLCSTLAAIAVARWYKVLEFESLQHQLGAVSREGRPAQSMLHEITRMREQIKQLDQHQTIAKELDDKRHVLTLLGAVSQAALESDGRLRVTECRVIDLQGTAAASSRTGDAAGAGTVTLVGVSLDSPAVAEFHDRLLRSGLFADVKLIKSNERREAALALYDYEVRCEL